MPIGASIRNSISPDFVLAVKPLSPWYMTVMSTGFHSIRDLSQGGSVLMGYRLFTRSKRVLRKYHGIHTDSFPLF
jgi:transposase-like protein